jgi:hypothetical protein
MQTHKQQHLPQLISAARSRQQTVAFSGYIGGFCDNLFCDVRQVLVRVREQEANVTEIRCPACRSILLIGDYEHGVTVATDQEVEKMHEQRSRREVWYELRRERALREGQRLLMTNGADLMRDITLDELAPLFRERDQAIAAQPDSNFTASGSSPGGAR